MQRCGCTEFTRMKDKTESSWWYVVVAFACCVALVWLCGGMPDWSTLQSYWPTTIRVATNINSSWLPDEERTCQSYPIRGGSRLAAIVCNPLGTHLDPTGLHLDHNIPVTFWGDLNRRITSDWMCRREKDIFKDKFVCRAIN